LSILPSLADRLYQFVFPELTAVYQQRWGKFRVPRCCYVAMILSGRRPLTAVRKYRKQPSRNGDLDEKRLFPENKMDVYNRG
jgi:hypothetical protein